ncbi:MAG: vWA domain-containing protein [Planctomycetota bacterium]|jgi:Ca-activated chloride channel family protein
MTSAIHEALNPLRDGAQRQVLLLTDGGIGFEHEVVYAVSRRLPPGSRVHAIGVGDAVNRSLTTPVARAGGGCEVIIGLGDDPIEAAERLVARTAAPLVVGLEVSGSAVTEVPKFACRDLLGAGPALIPIKLSPDGGEVVVRGTTAGAPWRQVITVGATAPGDGSAAIPTLYGRECVEDLEILAATGENVDAAIEDLGLAFRIATRRTSWVAIAEEPSVDPSEPTRRERIPQELPHGTSIEGFGLRSGMPSAARFRATTMYDLASDVVEQSIGTIEFERACRSIPLRAADQFRTVLPGRVTLADGAQVVVEFELEEPLRWEPPQRVVVELWSLDQTKAKVDLKLTTKAGSYPRGTVIRLVLTKASMAAGDISAIRFLGRHEDLSIQMEKV